MIYSKLNIPHELKENQANSVTLLRRRFSEYQLKNSREASGRLRGWVTAGETKEAKIKGLPAYLSFPRATQLLQQSYLKFQRGAIEVLPNGLGGGMKHIRPVTALESNQAETCEEEALQIQKPSISDINSLVEAISNEEKREKVRKVIEMLLENDPKEKDLNISAMGNIGDEGAKALAAALKVNQSIQTLSFYCNYIGDVGAQALGTALRVNQSIQSLSLRTNQIGDVGTQALGKALQVNHTLQVLDLCDNQIGDEGTQALAATLQVNQSLLSLSLGSNQIGAVGAQALGIALQINQSLQLLNLNCNGIGTGGAQALGAALQVNQSLQSLHLSWNGIGNTGIQALGTALQVNHTLQTLTLADNPVSAEWIITKKQIDTLLQANKQMATLFQQQITQVQNFLQSHQNEEGILLEHLPQLKELLPKWHSDSQNLISSLQKSLRQSGRTNLNDRYRKKLEGIITDLTNRLHNLWLEPFERKVAALSNEYVMGKESSVERNVDLGYALYETWLIFVGSDCPNWVEDYLQSLIPFGVLLDIAEGGRKRDVTDLTDACSLFERVLSFRNESKDSLFSLTNQPQKL